MPLKEAVVPSALPLWGVGERVPDAIAVRYYVAVNAVRDGREYLRVLTDYAYSLPVAEAARDRLRGAYPGCAVWATVSGVESENEGHRHALLGLLANLSRQKELQ